MAQMEKSMVYELEPQGGLAHQGIGFRFRTLRCGLGIHSLLPLRDGSVVDTVLWGLDLYH